MTQELVDAAIAYLNSGLSIIALTGKRPNTRFHEHGLLDALEGDVETDEDRELLARVFEHETTTGVGILIPRDVLVADVDSPAAAEALLRLSGGEMPATPTAKTRNGLHVWFRAPGVNRSVWVGGKALLFRGLGSYVAAPPSKHPDGGVYTWLWHLTPHGAPTWPLEIEDLPEGVAATIRTQEAVAETAQKAYSLWLWQLSFKDGTFKLHREMAEADLSGLVKAVETCQPGNRNNMLAWAALTAAEEGISLDEAMPQLSEAARKAGLDERETRVTIRAAYRRRSGG